MKIIFQMKFEALQDKKIWPEIFLLSQKLLNKKVFFFESDTLKELIKLLFFRFIIVTFNP